MLRQVRPSFLLRPSEPSTSTGFTQRVKKLLRSASSNSRSRSKTPRKSARASSNKQSSRFDDYQVRLKSPT